MLLLLLLLQLMFKVPSISTHAGLQTSTPLIHCRTDDVVIQVSPLLYQSLHQMAICTCYGNVGDGKFRSSFFIKSNISAMYRLVVVKFHINIANRWLFMMQRTIMAIILESFWHVLFRGAVFSGYGVHAFICWKVATMTICSMFNDNRTTRQRTAFTATLEDLTSNKSNLSVNIVILSLVGLHQNNTAVQHKYRL